MARMSTCDMEQCQDSSHNVIAIAVSSVSIVGRSKRSEFISMDWAFSRQQNSPVSPETSSMDLSSASYHGATDAFRKGHDDG